MTSISQNKKGRFLPKQFDIAHHLCFTVHDVMVEIIRAGEASKLFTTQIDLTDEESDELSNSVNIFDWLEAKGKLTDRANAVVATAFPAILSDALHCIFEALECSRKAKLAITFMLIRKPIQETLYVLESMALNKLDFANTLANDPLFLRPKNAGGIEGHQNRIRVLLNVLDTTQCFNANYIAMLRYNKSSEDSFDGICNLAMHLFTEHRAIRTDRLNINYIFSDWNSKITQWNFLYSRLPYLICYMHLLIEYILSGIIQTPKEYIYDIKRRISALVILWWSSIEPSYQTEELKIFYVQTKCWLDEHCLSRGFVTPTKKHLNKMYKTGAYPNEPEALIEKRRLSYKNHA